jgi:DNA-directed RNA polymerase subunit omega
VERPFPIEDLVDRVGNRYAIVVAVAKRARQLKSGARPLVEIGSKNPTTIALHEISAGLITIHEIEPTEPEMPAPSSPELEHAERLSQAVAELGEEDADEDEQEQEQEANSALPEQMSDDEGEGETDLAAQSDDQEDVQDDEDDAE